MFSAQGGKNNQVYKVNFHWIIGSYLSADLVLDDLLRYLVSKKMRFGAKTYTGKVTA